MTLELDRADWPAFCQRLSQRRVGSIVKIEALELGGVRAERIAGAIFESVVFDPFSNLGTNVIRFRLSNARTIFYEIAGPSAIRLRPSKTAEDFNPVEIDAEEGTTFVTMHPAIHGHMLAGLKLR